MAIRARCDQWRRELGRQKSDEHVLQVANQYLRTWKVSDLQKVCREAPVHRLASRHEVLGRVEYLARAREDPGLDYPTNALIEEMLTVFSHVLVRMAQLEMIGRRSPGPVSR